MPGTFRRPPDLQPPRHLVPGIGGAASALAGSFAGTSTFGAALSTQSALAGSFAAVFTSGAAPLTTVPNVQGLFAIQSNFGANLTDHPHAVLAGSFAGVFSSGFASLSVSPSGLIVANPDVDNDYLDFIKSGSLKIKVNSDRRNGIMDLTLEGSPADFEAGDVSIMVEPQITYAAGGLTYFQGAIRQVDPDDHIGSNGKIAVKIKCQDWTFLANDTIIDPNVASGVRTTIESDFARITWLLDTFFASDYGEIIYTAPPFGYVKTLLASMPAQDYTGLSLAGALDLICKVTGGTWYLDYGTSTTAPDPDLHYFEAAGTLHSLTTPFGVAATDLLTSTAHGFTAGDAVNFVSLTGGTGLTVGATYYVIASGLTANAFKVSATSGGAAVNFTTDITVGVWVRVLPAPFGLSDNPDNVTTFGYDDLSIPADSTELRNKVVIIGGNDYTGTFTYSGVAGSGPGAFTRTGIIRDSSITDAVTAQLAADAYFVKNATPQINGSLTTYAPGLEVGQDFALTSTTQLIGLYGIPVGTATFRITTIETQLMLNGSLQFKIVFGSIPRPIEHTIRAIVGDPKLIAESVIQGVLKGYVGEIIGWPLATPPTGFLICNGASLLRASYPTLFAVLGTTFGAADGTHFTLPNLTNRFIIGVGTNSLGATGGSYDHTHTGPSHTHTGPSHSHSHSHTVSGHTHSGPSHVHTQPSHDHVVLTHSHGGVTANSTSTTEAAGSGNVRTSTHSHVINAEPNAATTAGGADDTGSASGTTGSASPGTDTDATTGGTGATGSSGTGASGSNNPPFIALYYAIRFA